MATDEVLSVEDLSVDFHLRDHILHAVRNVSFALRRGGTTCLVGESGSGKSVTARALLRLVDRPGRVVGGRILLREPGGGTTDLLALPPSGRAIRAVRGRRIGLVFQEPMSSLSPVHTIGAQIVEAVRLHTGLDRRAARDRAADLLRQVEIADPVRMLDRYTFEFSGGMRQRAMIAMALAGEPDILVADEPTTALDVTTQAEILDLVKRLQVSRGMAMLLITHDMGVVAEVADDVAVMRYGRVVEHEDVDRIFHAPLHPYTQRLLSATRRLESSAAPPALERAEVVLSVQGLGKVFRARPRPFRRAGAEFTAVKDVSFELRAGESLGIVGESGSGKTTLGRMILRTTEPTEGAVRYRARNGALLDVMRLAPGDLRRYHREVRLVFQDPFASLNPRLTVRDIIAEPLVIGGTLRGRALTARVAALMDSVGLDPRGMERYPHAFSGGQRQRIGIARALAPEPRVVVADEATAALDVSIRTEVLDLLLALQARLGLSFVFISHDISVVRYFCHRVAVMHRGRIVEAGDTARVCSAPAEPYTQALISAVPNPDPRDKRMLHRRRFAAAAT